MSIIEYHEEFRTAIFLSSLTLGTFLFTMKTFIIQTIKKEIYDSPYYHEIIRNTATLKFKPPVYYKPLRNLSSMISISISVAFFNSFVQITIGVVGKEWAAILCLCISFVSWSLVLFVLFHIGRNMGDMIDYAEKDANLLTKDGCNCKQ